MTFRLCLLLSVFIAVSMPVPAEAGNWPQWRGERGDGISDETTVPLKWSQTENVVWRLKLPGAAGSTPVIWDDNIFLTSARGDDLVLMCVGTDGQTKWEFLMGTGNKVARGDEGNLASPSPSTDGKHVWAFVGTGKLACLDFAGSPVWEFDVQDRYGKFDIQFGMASTPVLDGEHLYLQLIHGDGKPESREALVVCLEKATGKEVWKKSRDSEAYAENEHSYASPVIYRDEKQAFLLTHGADYIIAHDLSDGHEIWRSGGLNPKDKYNPTLRLVASPVAVPGLIVAPSAKGGPVLGLSPEAQGTVPESARLWTRERDTPDVPSPVVYKGYVYLCRENGNIICLDAKTGQEVYQKATTRDRHRASPVIAGGNLYTAARNGSVTVTKTGPDFEILAVNKLDEPLAASPVFSNGRVYIRTFEALYAIGEK